MDEPLLLEEHSPEAEDSPLLPEETIDRREMTASSCYQKHCIYLPAMMGWFICSAALSSYNKVSDCQRLSSSLQEPVPPLAIAYFLWSNFCSCRLYLVKITDISRVPYC